MIGWLKLTTSEANSERLVLLQFWKEVFVVMSFHLWPFEHTIYNKKKLFKAINQSDIKILKIQQLIESTIGQKALPG